MIGLVWPMSVITHHFVDVSTKESTIFVGIGLDVDRHKHTEKSWMLGLRTWCWYAGRRRHLSAASGVSSLSRTGR